VENVVGKINGVLFSNKGTGYHVLRVVTEDGAKVTVRGSFPGFPMSAGVKAKFVGTWEDHAVYGRQLSAQVCELLVEKGRNGVITYLTGNVASIGPVTAGKLYGHFGDDLVEVLEKTPERLSECDFLSAKQIASMVEEWKKSSEQRSVAIFLTDLGLTSFQVRSAYTKFGASTTKLVRENAYCLYECPGIGFPSADNAARKLGVGRDDPRRVLAMIRHCMADLSHSEGHMYVTSDQVLKHSKRLFRNGLDHFSHGDYIAESAYYPALAELKRSGSVVSDGTKLYLLDNWEHEYMASMALSSFLENGPRPLGDLSVILSDYEKSRGVELSPEQRGSFMLLAASRLCVISGYPGTGKTTLISAFVHLFDVNNLDCFLLSPTGIAAKRLSQVTGKPASTIHRALGYKQDGGWEFNHGNKFHADAVIVDEMSMVDGETFYRLVSALPSTTILVLVGDDAQLPSVGAGFVLKALMGCPDVPHVALTKIYRQEQQSDIITVAHDMLAGRDIAIDRPAGSQFVFLHYRPAEVVDEICRLPSLMKEKGSNFQVIAPKYDGDLGVNTLNKRLREVLNPDFVAGRAAKIKHGSCDLYEGDRVMIIRNDYERMIFNGDVGKVQRISLKDDEVDVRVFNWFDNESSIPRYVDKVFTFKVEECKSSMNVAYACTTHKVQGQEFDYVVMPMTMQYGIMLYRNLVYTAITRAKKKVFIFGDPKAFAYAAANERETTRNSDLGALVSSSLRMEASA
jgi:exodeoxyribonuclease V alpha subunit